MVAMPTPVSRWMGATNRPVVWRAPMVSISMAAAATTIPVPPAVRDAFMPAAPPTGRHRVRRGLRAGARARGPRAAGRCAAGHGATAGVPVPALPSLAGDRQHALARIGAACFGQPASAQQRLDVAGQRGPVHAQPRREFTQRARRAGVAEYRILVDAQAGAGQRLIVQLGDLPSRAAQAEARAGRCVAGGHRCWARRGRDHHTCICTYVGAWGRAVCAALPGSGGPPAQNQARRPNATARPGSGA